MSFADYLDAKFALDERSLAPEVLSALLQRLRGMATLECLDVGAGTGATVQRLLRWRPSQPWRLTVLDRDAGLVEIAREATLKALVESQRRPVATADVLRTGDGRIEVRFATCEIGAYGPQRPCDLITAHAVLDLVALGPVLGAFARWLRPGGLLYTTINCDGEPQIRPRYREANFEAALLDCYTASMEQRRVDGLQSGGAYCGRRLQALLPQHGFVLVAQGSSDWDIRASGSSYRDRDQACLSALLDMIWKEGHASGRFEEQALERWRQDRMRTLQACRLEMHVPNRDLLARHGDDTRGPPAHR